MKKILTVWQTVYRYEIDIIAVVLFRLYQFFMNLFVNETTIC